MTISAPVATLAAGALLLTGCVAPAQQPGQASPPAEPGYRIVYNVWVDQEADDYDVFVMDLDGSNQRNLTRHPAVDWAYVTSGSRVYLVSDRDDEKRKYHLYGMDAGSARLTMLTPMRVRDSWLGAFDGRLLVATDGPESAEIVEVDEASGRQLRQLTSDNVKDNDPAYSPDGQHMVWRSHRSGIDELWIMHLATGQARQLTQFPVDDPGIDAHGYHAGPPRWHGDWISFCSRRGGNNSIFQVRSDGSDLQQLTHGEGEECWHDWSPDGRWLVYDTSHPEGGYDIVLRDLENGAETRLTTSPRYEQGPSFLAR